MNKDKRHASAPIYEGCITIVRQNQTFLCCPGHKGGRPFSTEFKQNITEIDLNNFKDADNLHCPVGMILEGQNLLADAYGVDKTFILVGGSTAGNTAAIMAATTPGTKILVQRNTHKSTVAGIIHSGAIPIWLTPEWDPVFKIFHGLPTDTLEKALFLHPDSACAFVLNPTYFGAVPDIAALVTACHRENKAILADEAHGPHFHFSPELPLAAEDAGSDTITQSSHKILSTLSQGAVLHVNKQRIKEVKVFKSLQLIQTTSPNFAIMASIDLARRQMMLEGKELLQNLIHMCREARQRLKEIPGVMVLERPLQKKSKAGFYDLDETKIVIDVKDLGLSGYEVLFILNREFKIQPELAGPSYILCVLSVGTERKDLERLVEAFSLLSKRKQAHPSRCLLRSLEQAELGCQLSCSPDVRMPPREAFYADATSLEITKCAGRICAEVITPYPPGIPILIPGEYISKDIIDFLISLHEAGNPISCTDPSLKTIEVLL
jgi:arginine/lysine/ornithine decarboxylase